MTENNAESRLSGVRIANTDLASSPESALPLQATLSGVVFYGTSQSGLGD